MLQHTWVAVSSRFHSLVSCSVEVPELGNMLTTALLYLVARAAKILRRGWVNTWNKKRRPARHSADVCRFLDANLS